MPGYPRVRGPGTRLQSHRIMEDLAHPDMMFISRAQESNQQAGVEDNPFHFPKSSKCRLLVERSVCVPLPIPMFKVKSVRSKSRWMTRQNVTKGGAKRRGRRTLEPNRRSCRRNATASWREQACGVSKRDFLAVESFSVLTRTFNG